VDHYLDLRLRDDPEFAPHHLLSALYTKLHRALVAADHGRVGVSFPDLVSEKRWLGKRLRLHGSRADLASLMQTDWLNGMRDHIDASTLALVPDHARHRTVHRVQSDSNPERLRRRLLRRHELDEKTARERIPDASASLLRLPWLQLRSASTGQHFRLFIEHSPIQTAATAGVFSTYGLSRTTTVPWF